MDAKPRERKDSSVVAQSIARSPKEEREQGDREVEAAIDQALSAMREKLRSPELKPTITDFVKLLQMKKDMEGERPKDITVRWVDACSENPSIAK